ncbi:hypothetical protein CLCR_06186 [Cladophialophora carrionii]|uniref:Uncharacterized protein n=1 Tax=Cladophialophora carrionii TaxID=86049 RepID=A0A1C1C9B8_9EURO|nr:hypothetical protein CLCR_06186 [Cladophialophora carrionii]
MATLPDKEATKGRMLHELVNKVEFVVAHHNEDLSWLSDVEELTSVYSKGSRKIPIFPRRQTVLPNIGREGHTYLHHLITQYDNLADIVVFCQGQIDDHVDLSASQIWSAASMLGDDQIMTFPPFELEHFDVWTGKHVDLYPVEHVWPEETFREPRRDVQMAPLRPCEYFRRFIGRGKIPLSIAWQPGAIFAVSRNLIHRHPPDFYQELLNAFFGGVNATHDPETGHILEKFWLSLWMPEKYICWKSEEISDNERNEQGQLAKGRWNVRLSCIRNEPTVMGLL